MSYSSGNNNRIKWIFIVKNMAILLVMFHERFLMPLMTLMTLMTLMMLMTLIPKEVGLLLRLMFILFVIRDSFTREGVIKRIQLCLYYRSLSLKEKCEVISSLLEIPKCLFDDCDEKDIYTIGVLGYAVLRSIYRSLLKEMRFKNWKKEKWDYYYSFVITSLFFHGHLEHTRFKFTDEDRKCFFYVNYVMSVWIQYFLVRRSVQKQWQHLYPILILMLQKKRLSYSLSSCVHNRDMI